MRAGCSPPRPRKEKYIHDPLWGNLVFTSAEVLIIDSPLLQRLRYIHQLGLASLLYPGAIHTRFEHTLGVAHLAGNIADRVLRVPGQEKQGDPFELYCRTKGVSVVDVVRIAALFHDTGHFFLSHAGEKALTDVRMNSAEMINSILYDVIDTFPEEPHLTELLAALIITSQHAQGLLSAACASIMNDPDGTPSSELIENVAAIAALFILGQAPTSELTPFANILSGTIDADKCDYLRRDSVYTGVPVAVDINRIVDKLTRIPMPLTSRMADFFEAPSPSPDGTTYCEKLAIAHSAARNIDDMLISRALMYEKVYFHHKVLTAEQTFFHGLRQLEDACPDLFSDIGRLLELTDYDFIGAEKAPGLQAFIARHGLSVEDDTSYNAALGIFTDITFRNLYKRCCVLPENALFAVAGENGLNQEVVNQFLSHVISDAKDAEKPKIFTDKLDKEIRRMANTLEEPIGDKCNYYGVVLAPYGKSSFSNITFAVAVDEKNGKKYNQIFNIESWQDGRLKQIAQHLVLAPGSLKSIAHLAVEMVLYRDYGIMLSPSARAVCKIDRTDYRDKKKNLAQAGWYNTMPALLDIEVFLSHVEDEAIRDIVHNFAQYQPGTAPGKKAEGVPPVTRQRILAFVAQFAPFIPPGVTQSKYYQALVTLLAKVRLITQTTFADHLDKVFKDARIPSANYIIFPLGNFRDSASHLAYYFSNKVGGSHSVKPMDKLGEFLDDDSPLVFYDDAFYSGNQVVSMFNRLMRKSDRLNKHVEPLPSDDLVEKLKRKNISIVYGYGNEEKVGDVKNALEGLGLNISLHYAQKYPQKIFDMAYPGIGSEALASVKAAFAAVGEQLVRPNMIRDPEGWSDERVQQSKLGYDNAEQALVYAWNTPTSTLTALWKSGTVTVNGVSVIWSPLFPRDEKQ